MKDFIKLDHNGAPIGRNPKELPLGTIGYYVKKSGHVWTVGYGIVSDHYPKQVVLDLLDMPERRVINGIHVSKINFPSKWRKLPKGWGYDTQLFSCELDPSFVDVKNTVSVDIKDPKSILAAFEAGFLEKVENIRYGYPNSEVDNEFGWRLVWVNDNSYHPSYISLDWYKVYATYEEAMEVIEQHRSALQQISELSDYEWSLDQIEKDLVRWQKSSGVDDSVVCKIREFLYTRDNVEDIETRIFGGTIQWKYFNKKKWWNITL